MEDKELKEQLIEEFNESGESNLTDFIKQKEEEAINNGDIELSEFYHRILSGKIVEDEMLMEYAEDVQEELNYKNYLESEYKKYYIAYSEQEEHYKSFEHYIESKVAALNYVDFASDSELEKELWDILKLHKEKETQKEEEILGDKKVEDSVSLEDMTLEELIELATKNKGIINENDQVIKGALIKRIVEQQQEIGEQEEEIKRLRGQKVK